MEKSHRPVEVQQYSKNGSKTEIINAAIEAPVTLSVNGASWLTFQCTPTEIESLVIGFLYNEGFINSLGEVESMHLCTDKTTIDVWLNHQVTKPETWHRSTGCFNGFSADESERKNLEYLHCDQKVDPQEIFDLIELFIDRQVPRTSSGGIHTSALADGKGIVLQLIDIGRHNTFDKLAGRVLLDNLKVNSPTLITTGRISSELVLKSVIMRASMLISLRSASQSAISLANQWGVTLISGANRFRFNLLSHPERVNSV
jgi:FdhD protein